MSEIFNVSEHELTIIIKKEPSICSDYTKYVCIRSVRKVLFELMNILYSKLRLPVGIAVSTYYSIVCKYITTVGNYIYY